MTANTVDTVVTASKWHLLVALALGATIFWLVWSDASAHAAYESSSPEFAAVLSEPPSEIRIRFTQELFRREGANGITLTHLDGGAEVRLGEPRIDNEDRHVMTASVDEELERGRYVVSWTNLSAEDGDSDSGSYPFYLGRSPTPTEEQEDRRNASELLIVYPGDDAERVREQEATPPRTPTVVRSESSDNASLGVAPVIWLVVGLVAALILVGALGFQLGRGRARR